MIMQTHSKNPQRLQPRVEPLEGKILLSAVPVVHHFAPHVATAPIVAQSPATFSGTLTGPYSNAHVPGFGNILSYLTSGSLSGIGSARLRGTLVIRGSDRPNRLIGQLMVRNEGGSVVVNVLRTAVRGTYSFNVALARGNDTPYDGETGELTITQTPNISAPFFVSGQATMTFTPG
jgi:hypothetical protein